MMGENKYNTVDIKAVGKLSVMIFCIKRNGR
jgi:hypothetical protein